MEEKLTYRDAGVDIDAGNASVRLIKDSVRATYRPEVLGDLGGFGGLFAGAGRRHPKIGRTGLRDGAVESYPAFARGDGEPVALVLQGVQAG